MEIMHMRAAGFGAAVDAYARDEGELWFLSMLGNQQSVRALWARLVKGEMAYLSSEQYAGGVPCWLAREARREWRFHSARLPGTGAYHGMLVPNAALYATERQDFLLLARNEEEAPALHYRFLNRRLDVPLHPAWSGWLWERALATGEVLPLDALDVRAYRCTPDPIELREAIGRAIRGHRLTVSTDDVETRVA
jgi:hypothetical protein